MGQVMVHKMRRGDGERAKEGPNLARGCEQDKKRSNPRRAVVLGRGEGTSRLTFFLLMLWGVHKFKQRYGEVRVW